MNTIAHAAVPPVPTGGAALDATAADTPATAQEGGGKPFQEALGAALQTAAGEPVRPDTTGTLPVEGQNLVIDGKVLPLLSPAAGEIPHVPDPQGQAEAMTLTVGATQSSATLPVLVAPPSGGEDEQPAEATVPVSMSGKPVLLTAPAPIQPKGVPPTHASAPRVGLVVQTHTPSAPSSVPDTASFKAEIDGKVADALMNGSPLPERSGMSADTPGMANLVSAASAAASSSSPARMPVEASSISMPVASPRWGEALGERVVWMAGNQTQTAQVQINPPELGPLEVRITVSQGQASVQFSSAHGEVRDAVQAALPRLKEMLGEAGVALLDVDVSARSFAQQRQDSQASNGDSFGPGSSASDNESHAGEAPAARLVARGLVDLYA